MAERVVRAATAMALCASVGTANAGPCSGLDLCDTLGLFSGGKRVGHLIECLREQPNGAVLETNAIDAEVTTGGGGPRVTVSIEETRLFDSLGALVRASQRIAGASGETEWKLTKARGQWRITTVTAGQPSTQILPNYGGERIDTYCSLYRQILEGTIEEGDTWIDTSVELTSGRTVATKLVCKGVPGKGGGSTWHFVVHDELSARDIRWIVSRSGKTLLRSVPPAFVARAPGYSSPAETVDTQTGRSAGLEEVFRVPAERGARPDERVVLRLLDGIDMPESGRGFYSASDSVWLLRSPKGACPASQTRDRLAKEQQAHLSATPTLQIEHPRIRALSDSLRQGRDEVCPFVADATQHVYRRLRRRTTPTFSSALETLDAGYGDCGEHAVLLAAILRAGAVPARVILGLVYVEDRHAYIGHAWVGIHLKEGWVFADPAFGRFPAKSGLIPLLIDDSGRDAVDVLKMLDRVDISYVPSE